MMVLTYAWLNPMADANENLTSLAEDGARELADAVAADPGSWAAGFDGLLEAIRFHAAKLDYSTLAIDAEDEAGGTGVFVVVAREG